MKMNALKPIIFLKYWKSGSLKTRPTAWLDGLRGCAALVVTMYHFAYFWPWAQQGYAVTEQDYHWLQFYFVRLIISGDFSVRIFFVISGQSSGFPNTLEPTKSSRSLQ
jgi:peptidoglycan/LPS O-acetylase OafA/YrhL